MFNQYFYRLQFYIFTFGQMSCISNKNFGAIPSWTIKNYINIINNEFGGNIPTNTTFVAQLSKLTKYLNYNSFVARTGFNPNGILQESHFDTFFGQLRAERLADDNDYFNKFNRADYKINDPIDVLQHMNTQDEFQQQLDDERKVYSLSLIHIYDA